MLITMDGQIVNWKFHDSILEKRNEIDSYPGLIDSGLYSLHVVHGAFRAGVKKTRWVIDAVLKAMQYLFDDFPAKTEDYRSITGPDFFPLLIFVHRWIEDKKAADRPIEYNLTSPSM